MSRKHVIKLAYADDHAIVRKGIIGHIESSGRFKCLFEAGNGEELLQQLKQARVLPDICMLDIFMPVKDGYETLRDIRKYWPSMKILVLTGHTTDYYLVKMILAGTSGYLVKNCSPEELENALISIYRNGIYYSDPMTLDYVENIRNNKAKLPVLEDNEARFLKYVCTDLTYVQIAEQMKLSTKQVEWLRACTFRKFNAVSRTSLAMLAVQFGLVSVDALPVIPTNLPLHHAL